MKIILAGSTGFIGQEILFQCLSSPQITSIVVLSRRALNVEDPKLKIVILEDFTDIPEHVMEELKGCEGVIWALGSATRDPKLCRRINVDYTLSAASSFRKLPMPKGKKFRFVYCSGILAVRDQEKKPWFLGEGRKIRGEVENRLLEFNQKYPKSFDSAIVRPAVVLSKEPSLFKPIMALAPSVGVDELAAAMIEAAVSGSEKKIIENGQLRTRGRTMLKMKSEKDGK